MVDSSGNEVVTYSYDSWGKLLTLGGTLASTVGTLNPFRYREYYYDTETALYYLQSRYYNPEIRRFISMDDASYAYDTSCIDENLYAYCGNNPINRYDDNGMSWNKIISWANQAWAMTKSGINWSLHSGNTMARSAGIDMAAIGGLFLDMQEDNEGIYHANFNCWQQHWGYNSVYDVVFDMGTSMRPAKFEFTYNHRGYTIWAWKGDYINLGAGDELGIYRGSSGQRTVDTSLALPMIVYLFYKRYCIIEYYPHGNQWWATAFNPKYQNVNADDLEADFVIWFKDNPELYYGLKKRYGGDPRWQFFDGDYLEAELDF